MPRPRLRHPSQPILLQVLLGGVEFLASLRLAVVVIVTLILVLASATFIETTYGAPAARFAVYRSWWFMLLGVLLGVNVFTAAAVRFPWKRYQTGFVVTHAGILILLGGSLLSARHGIDAQLSVYEGTMSHWAFEDTLHFEIERVGFTQPDTAQGNRTVRIPFQAGPFNWRDYSRSWRHLLWAPPGWLPLFPWRLAHRDQGIVYRSGGVTLEVLDYYADSKRISGGYLAGYASVPTGGEGGWVRPWQPVQLTLESGRFPGGATAVLGSRVTLPDGTRIVFCPALEDFEREAFLLSYPEGTPGERGQVVLVHERVRYVIPLQEAISGSVVPLGQSGIRVTGIDYEPGLQSVQIRLENSTGQRDDLILFADLPEFNRSAEKLRVGGAFWVDFAALMKDPTVVAQLRPEATAGADRPRVEICQGSDKKLYYRAWLAPRFLAGGTVPLDGRVLHVPSGLGYDVKLLVNTFLPFDPQQAGQEVVVPLPFRKGARMTEPRVRIRASWGGSTQEMWLAVLPRGAMGPINPDEVCRLQNGSEEIRITVKYDAVDVGFWVKLLEFQRRLDPGTNQPSHYASLVDLYVPEKLVNNGSSRGSGGTEFDPETGQGLRLVHSKVLITLNHPINVIDPITGRSYRLYQESFSGPFRPGDPVYERVVGDREAPDQIYVSTLSVNYDPGRGFKYMGSLLIVGGIVIMYLMRAYMFRPRSRPPEGVSESEATPTRTRETSLLPVN